MPPSGKTLSLLSRFPAFYNTGEASHLHQLMAVLGMALEGAEADLVRVLRSHFVDTANNTGSQGFVYSRRGNLDQIFALYLERLGGTSQLIQVNAQFQPSDLLQVETMTQDILFARTDLAGDLDQSFARERPQARDRLRAYDRRQAYLTPEAWQHPAQFITLLLIAQDPLSQELREQLSPDTQAALARYDGGDTVPRPLLLGLCRDLNRRLEQRSLQRWFEERAQLLRLGHRLAIEVNRLQGETIPATDTLTIALAQALRKRLPLPLQRPLFGRSVPLNEGAIAPLQQAFKERLVDPDLCADLLALGQGQRQGSPVPENLRLAPAIVQQIFTVAHRALRQILVGPGADLPQVPMLPRAAQALLTEPLSPINRLRLNRLLLETAYAGQIEPSQIPTQADVQSDLTNLFNQVVLPDAQFYPRNRDFFADLRLDGETQQLMAGHRRGDRDQASIQRLNRLLLETAFPTELHKSYVPYRERLRELIQVLQRGASTQQGIRDIVAANLGIFSDSEAAQQARKTIEIEEYLPELLIGTAIAVQPFSAGEADSDLPRQFTLHNPNVEPTAVTLRLELNDNRQDPPSELAPLSHLTLVNAETGTYFTYDSALLAGNTLSLLANGRLSRNGEDRGQVLPTLVLPVGESTWHFTAQVGELPGRLEAAQFDFSRFDQAVGGAQAMTAEQASNYRISVAYDLVKLTPGVFLVKVPWDIPGFTDKFDDYGDHPRSQIPAIINRVRAAGVDFAIAYSKTFRERHRHRDWLTVEPADRLSHPLYDSVTAQLPASPPHFVEHHHIQDDNFDMRSEQKPYGAEGVEHRMGDRLLVSGLFDYTTFDSGNTFA